MNPDPILLDRIERLHAHFTEGRIPTLAQHEVHPDVSNGSRERYLYFTLPVTINFQRSSPAMWQSANTTWHDPETQSAFFPEWVASHSEDELREKLVRHKLALQPNKHTTIWRKIALTLHEFYDSDPRKIIAEANSDAGKLVSLLQQTHRKRFPYLSGPKLSNYWPFILSHYTDVQFKNQHLLSIIPDTHVIQSSIQLGMVPEGASSLVVEDVWRKILEGSSLTPAVMHPVLWNWSRNNFKPSV